MARSESVTRLKENGDVRSQTIAVVGLGYVGLPLATAFDRRGFEVIGYDIDESKIAALDAGWDPTEEVGNSTISQCEIRFDDDPKVLADADVILVAVPTPVTDGHEPNLTYVEQAGETIGKHLTRGTTVVLESTVFPGATRKILTPAIKRSSGFTVGRDFTVGYSPERVVPGDTDRGLGDVVKIVSAGDAETREELAALYAEVVEAGVHPVDQMEVAETAKCIENIQRDVNIALTNELAIACDTLGIDWEAVLEAASTKWNFHDEYRPGLVGGHCIPVDPYFFLYESQTNGFDPDLIATARRVNDYLPRHVGTKVVKSLNQAGKVPSKSQVLILGLAYKADVGDIRTSMIDGVIEELREFGLEIVGHDPHADNREMAERFGIEVQHEVCFDGCDAVVIGAAHDVYRDIDFQAATDAMADRPVILDADGSFDLSEPAGESPIVFETI